MVEQLHELGGVLTAYTAGDRNWEGLPASRAVAERRAAREEGGSALEVAYGAALTLMHLNTFSVLGHLGAVATLLDRDDPPAPSLMVICRSVLELAARTWWLADPAVDTVGRVSRGYLEKLHSAHEYELLREASPGAGVAATTMAAEIVAEIEALPLSVDGRRKSLRVTDETRPSTIDLLAHFPGEDLAERHDRYFRLFSAPTHGSLFGVTLLLSAPPPDDLGRTTATYRPAQAWLDGPVSTAELACGWAVQRVARLAGWDESPLDRFLRSIDDLYGDDAT